MQSQSQPGSMPTKRAVSLAVAIIMLVVGAAAGVGVGYFGAPRTTTSGPLCSSGQTITIGELLDLSGSLPTKERKRKILRLLQSTTLTRLYPRAAVASDLPTQFRTMLITTISPSKN